jgi:hypothetical protein
MSHKKFIALCVDLHYIDTSFFSAAECAIKKEENKFWKMGGYEDDLNLEFKKHRCCECALTLDEFTCPFKGRHCCRCFNPNKPEKYHLKGFSLNEASSGYCLQFLLYQGRDEKRPVGICATQWPALFLIRNVPFIHHKGYHMWADNWFTRLKTIQSNLGFGVGYTGTAKANRVGKAWLAVEKKGMGKKDRGEYSAKQTTLEGQTVTAIQWKDNKVVTMLTTHTSKVGHVTRNNKDKKTHTYTKSTFDIPSIISAYNYNKVGTDRMDQSIAQYYRNSRLRWHVKLTLHLTYIALHNAYISYLDLTNQQRAQYKYSMFLDELSHTHESEDERFANMHVPWQPGKKARGKGSFAKAQSLKESERPRGLCKVCGIRTPYKCLTCDVYLHLHTKESNYKCWGEYHLKHT